MDICGKSFPGQGTASTVCDHGRLRKSRQSGPNTQVERSIKRGLFIKVL